jgi:serine protease Do
LLASFFYFFKDENTFNESRFYQNSFRKHFNYNKMRSYLFILMIQIFIWGCHASSDNNVNTNLTTIVQPGDFTEAAELATPAVVHITIYSKEPAENLGPLEQFLRDRDEYKPDEELQMTGLGSGVIVSNDGFIVTVNHILEKAEAVEITLNDRRVFVAEVAGRDPVTDLALLKIDEKDLPVLALGASDDVRVGEWVAAVGNPFNLTSTVTAGIVSAKGRDLNILEGKDGRSLESFIQTDAALNPGNSGGALLNIRGELIGINAAIASPTGAFAGYSFAVPVNIVKKVIDDIREFGEVRRGVLGLDITNLNQQIARELELNDLSGAFVQKVRAGTPAAEAGIQPGDIILSVEGMDIKEAGELQEFVALSRPGQEITLKYKRNGKTIQTGITLSSD